EGQRRYVESVSTYAKQFLDRLPRPDVESITGLTPAVSIQQSAPTRSARSTVGTSTEVHDYLRLLFARLGTVHCVKCERPVVADSARTIALEAERWPADTLVWVLAPIELSAKLSWDEQAGHLLRAGYTRAWIGGAAVPLDPTPKLKKGTKQVHIVVDRLRWAPDERERLVEACEQAFRRGEESLALVVGEGEPQLRTSKWQCSNCGTPAMRPEPALFSFNSPLGVCPTCKGFGDVLTFAPELIVPDGTKTLRDGAIAPWAGSWRSVAFPRLQKLAADKGVDLDVAWDQLPSAHQKLVMEGSKEFRGAIPFLERLQQKSYKAGNRFIVKRYQSPRRCGVCHGTRLRPEALLVRLGGKNIAEVCAMPVGETAKFLAALEFSASQKVVAGVALHEMASRLQFLLRVDLGYLTLDRHTRTLSGGEAQRIELANALGANLADTLYVLDEPTAGLHPRDTERLIAILNELTSRSNTLVVVEHDPLVIRAAEYLADLGPGA
ncbi:MAG: excinuclease ABC subunit UvrA, partial [Candidatus Eisenbacteria bacterium]|nr:excinuclease ABC subunit UvrA [Candidatus Eisenbacteria bacterium]